MFKLILGLAFVSMILGQEYPEDRKNRYFVLGPKIDYLEAYAHCRLLGAILATEKTPEETKELEEALEEQHAGGDHWIGGILTDNDWIWLDAGNVMEYKNWVSEEPKDAGTCLLKTPGSESGKWKAAPCTEEHRFVCYKIL